MLAVSPVSRAPRPASRPAPLAAEPPMSAPQPPSGPAADRRQLARATGEAIDQLLALPVGRKLALRAAEVLATHALGRFPEPKVEVLARFTKAAGSIPHDAEERVALLREGLRVLEHLSAEPDGMEVFFAIGSLALSRADRPGITEPELDRLAEVTLAHLAELADTRTASPRAASPMARVAQLTRPRPTLA
ncbi:MAG: hypothetical protein VKS61_14635 [Candidatus Sericytochromatia bacterium]|nr:hypothetical protein [Candidatus Sericytochromatia bacterium]